MFSFIECTRVSSSLKRHVCNLQEGQHLEDLYERERSYAQNSSTTSTVAWQGLEGRSMPYIHIIVSGCLLTSGDHCIPHQCISFLMQVTLVSVRVQEKKRKEKVTLFSNHKGSLLRQQPGAMILGHSTKGSQGAYPDCQQVWCMHGAGPR